MKTRAIRALVVAFSVTAVGVLALSPSRAANTTAAATPAAAPASDPMGGCCGSQTPAADSSTATPAAKTYTCGENTHKVVAADGTASCVANSAK